MDVKDVIQRAVLRVRQGKGSNEDKAIMHLLMQCKDLKEQMQNGAGPGQANIPVHQSTPWYMQ